MFGKNVLYFLWIAEIYRSDVNCNDGDEDDNDNIVQKCVGYKSMKFKKATRDHILHLHNEFRDTVAAGLETRGLPGPQPSAKNIMKLEWYPYLQKLAEEFLNHCNIEENVYEEKSIEFKSIGLNVQSEKDKDNLNITEVLFEWFNEVESFNNDEQKQYSSDRSENGKYISEYTQAVWAETYLIGCALASFIYKGAPAHRFACLYAESGNKPEHEVYERGLPCQVCKCDANYKHLCKNKLFPDGNTFLVEDDDSHDNGDYDDNDKDDNDDKVGIIVDDYENPSLQEVTGTSIRTSSRKPQVLKGVRFFSELKDYDPCDCKFSL